MTPLLARRVLLPWRLMKLASLGGSVLAFTGAALASNLHGSLGSILTAFFGVLAAVGVINLVAALLGRERAAGILVVDERALWWNDAAALRRKDIEDAVAYSNGARWGICVRTAVRSHFFEVADAAEADALVAELRMGPARARLPVAEDAEVPILIALLLAGTFGTGWNWMMALVALGLALRHVIVMARRPRWVIGSDGLLVKVSSKPERFIPYADIEQVQSTRSRITVTLRTGPPVSLRCPDDAVERRRPRVGASALARRIVEAKAASEARMAAPPEPLARAGRDLQTWMQALDSLSDHASTYREATVSREQLWGTLEDAGQAPELRAAAAVALRAGLADDERPRLRVVAGAAAAPRLRVALERLASGDEPGDALALALDDAADARGVRRARG